MSDVPAFNVFAEFDECADARGAARALSREGVEPTHVHLGDASLLVLVEAANLDEARVASMRLARSGATNMRWTDGRGAPLRGPGRTRGPGGWHRPGADSRRRPRYRQNA